MRRTLVTTTLLGTLASVACGPSKCEQELAELDAMIRAIPEGNHGFWLRAPNEQIVLLDDAIPAADFVGADALFVYVTKTAVATHEYDAQFIEIASPEAAARSLAALDSRLEGRRPVLVIVPSAPWRNVQVVLEGARAHGLPSIDVLFRRAKPMVAAPTPAQPIELDPVHPDGQALHALTRMLRLRGYCPPIDEMLSAPMGSLAEAIAHLRANAVDSLRKCECGADAKAYGALVHAVLAPPFTPAVVTLPLPADPGAILELPADVPWSEIYPRVVEAREPAARFVAR